MNSSVLWIFLIVAWLFILLPMVLRGRPEVRKTTEAVANTRVLHRGGERAAVRRRSAGRHPSNPDYVRKREEPALKRAVIEEDDVPEETETATQARTDAPVDAEVTDVLDAVDADEAIEADEVDLDAEVELDDEAGADLDDEFDDDLEDLDDEYEDDLDAEAEDDADDRIDDEADDLDELDEPAPAARPTPRELRGRGSYTPDRIAERDARRYAERRRTVTGLLAVTVLAIASCFFWQPYGYIAAATMVVLSGLYLYFLRRTALEEQQYRAQRAERLRRHAAEDERVRRQQEEAIPARPAAPPRRRPGGMIVVELDDEDPAFDHLPVYDFSYAESVADDDEYRRAV
ncbi:hypothetical protein MYK68_04515 [Gordonia sp. PP30]|uniref:divisome protein SepX/GlpR n=1 Tax=Gordonia sp. PP30 TaxID=2935861 RepID=UPI001FFFD7D6|nr:gephyrin-like molybdotransferase receptor GlpR [Gordonia sp. PP30]UQE75876.1 hypothetical protein MYK68_04515 [Gordonia sp. PP30]